MSALQSFTSDNRFYDDANFPYGLRSSGDFTRQQADILEECGRTLLGLDQGVLEPSNEEQVRFLSVCRGEVEAETAVEKAWMAYRKAVFRRGIVLNFHGGRSDRITYSYEEEE